VPEFALGSVHVFQAPGTSELRADGPKGYSVLPDRDEGAPRLREPRDRDCLGFVEEAPLPLLDALQLAFLLSSNQWVLVTSSDPLLSRVEHCQPLGFIEAWPIHPRLASTPLRPRGVRPLVRTIDLAARRHRYAVTPMAAGEVSLDLGRLHTQAGEESVPLWLVGDRIVTGDAPPPKPQSGAAVRARWIAAPLMWRGMGPLFPRIRAAARRVAQTAWTTPVDRATRRPDDEPVGYLWATAAPGRRPVYQAAHPVTGDQLLTPWPLEASDMGYGEALLLGWTSTGGMSAAALEPRQVDVPWASRFGRRVRRW
jgi:hypothetical protein